MPRVTQPLALDGAQHRAGITAEKISRAFPKSRSTEQDHNTSEAASATRNKSDPTDGKPRGIEPCSNDPWNGSHELPSLRWCFPFVAVVGPICIWKSCDFPCVHYPANCTTTEIVNLKRYRPNLVSLVKSRRVALLIP